MRPNGRLALDLRERLSQGPLVWLSQLEVKKGLLEDEVTRLLCGKSQIHPFA